MSLLRRPKEILIILGIIIIAVFFRVYNYYERIYVYADNALFVQAAYFAKETLQISQIGPFAQAPFFTGPWWLWILEIIFILPFGSLTPWFFMSFLSFIFILLIFFVGKDIGGKKLGLLTSFLAAASTAQIDNAFMTWNAAFDPFCGLLAIFFFIKFIKTKKAFFIFLLSLIISLAITIHFQTFLLSPLILIALFANRFKFKNLIAVLVGGLIPIIPFLYFDIRFHWFETRRILDYLLVAQYRIYVPNRWLTYLGVYWPDTWAWVIGGKAFVTYIIAVGLFLFSLLGLKKWRKNKLFFSVLASFVISLVMFRYFRGERFFYYTNFAHAFIILLTAWFINEVYKAKKIVGIIFAFIIIFFSVRESINNFTPRVITYNQVKNLISEVYQKYPSSNFDIYECPFNGSLISTPVSYFMYFDKRNTLDGVKIGVCNENNQLSWREVSLDEINKPFAYQHKSTENIYTEMTQWWVTNPPKKDQLY